MQLYLETNFSSPAQASFFLICTGDSIGTAIAHASCQGLEEVQTVAQTSPNLSPNEPLHQPPLCYHSKSKKQAPDTLDL